MKTKHLQILLLLFALVAMPLTSAAQDYSIPWFKTAGGGGASTNATNSLTGTIGQHDAGVSMTNGQYSFNGGFWGFLSATAAPRLRIVPAGPGQVTISWSPDSTGYRLQETLSLTPAGWSNSPSGTNNPVTLPAVSAARYYRLIQP